MINRFVSAGRAGAIRHALPMLLLLLTMGRVAVAAEDAGFARGVGEKVPLFAAATSQDTLFDYDRDIYGRHHLVLSFMPAAFTPV